MWPIDPAALRSIQDTVAEPIHRQHPEPTISLIDAVEMTCQALFLPRVYLAIIY
jgi:hypothetical protein